ncbi:hypothetical protein E6H29_05065 [Candidatus Bathyarchaeota archaeon]|nr:MAG: hypothetical protein E6H29_05065 [Candidatus Bathyarchaeota archaeon]
MRKRLAEFLKPYTRRESGLLYLALTYLLVFELLVQILLPQFINERVIYEVGTLLATIEGIFIGLSGQIRIKSIRDWVAVGAGIPALMLSIITVTIAIAYFQSIQLGYLSQDVESSSCILTLTPLSSSGEASSMGRWTRGMMNLGSAWH